MSELSVIQEATLKALADACNFSLAAHVPEQAVTRRFPRNLRGDVKKSLDKLRSKGYCTKHPTGKNMTWQLSRKGLILVSRSVRSI
jgi:hypothetical protein